MTKKVKNVSPRNSAAKTRKVAVKRRSSSKQYKAITKIYMQEMESANRFEAFANGSD